VIAFDSWTEGAVHAERLVPAFQMHGFDLLLIHIGSWGHDIGRPREERIGRLRVRDISYYEGLSFKEILIKERPAAVLFFSTTAFAHRAFNRYCRHQGIATLHVYHGLVRVQSTVLKRMHPINLQRQLAMIFARLGKSIARIWPVYLRALWETDASLHDCLRFGRDVWRQATGQSYVGAAARDASTTACCVYAEADVSHAMERYGMSQEAIHVVGNPDLTRFGFSEDDTGVCLLQKSRPSREIMYIDTALIEAGAVFDNVSDFVRHLVETREALGRQGFQFVVKLHPAHLRTSLPGVLTDHGVAQCSNEQFLSRLKNSTAVIVEPSSAALIPGFLGLPMLLAQYGKLEELDYGEVLTSYPRASALTCLDDLAERLTGLWASPHQALWDWIRKNSGPLPSAEMPNRVADVIESIVYESRKEPAPNAQPIDAQQKQTPIGR
jgi:hypothetical protein